MSLSINRSPSIHIVWSKGYRTPRLNNRIYCICWIILIGYIITDTFFFLGRTTRIREDGLCILGFTKTTSISLVTYDLVQNLFFTSMFMWPLLRSNIISPRLKFMVRKTACGALAALVTSAVNTGVVIGLNGIQLGLVTFNTLIVYWVSSGASSDSPSMDHPSLPEIHVTTATWKAQSSIAGKSDHLATSMSGMTFSSTDLSLRDEEKGLYSLGLATDKQSHSHFISSALNPTTTPHLFHHKRVVMSFLQSSDDLSVKLEFLRAKALAMEFEKHPSYGRLLSRTQNPKTTLIIPSIPSATTEPRVTLMDAFFELKEKENQSRHAKRTTTLMDVILDSRDSAKKAARKAQNVELDEGVLADDEESEEEVELADSSDWESQESDVEDEAEGMAITCVLSKARAHDDYDGDSELSSALSDHEQTSYGYKEDDESDKENNPILGSPASDKENDPNLTTFTLIPRAIRAVMGEIILPCREVTFDIDEEKENNKPITHARCVLGDVPGSNFDEDKENLPLPTLSTTVAIDQYDRVPLQDVEGSNYDEEKENRVLAATTKERRLRSPLAEQHLEIGDGEGKEVQGGTASDEGRGREAGVRFGPLATMYLRRRSIIEVSPIRPGAMKENGAVENLEVTAKDPCGTVPPARSTLSPLEK
ncbi:hypothetical protein VNI00_013707 [Paramarasmius palmivorus]|uniref:Uncharacterized protein n=1 Tax=Paramarasmius palmivorus TaxID=297713 RepID=A0AAW0BXB7_9AGAR